MTPETMETKAVSGNPTSLEVVDAFDEFMRSFEAFKETNDERLTQIEERVSSDVVTVEKMERINRSLDDQKRRMENLVLKTRRPHLDARGEAGLSPIAAEHKTAWQSYMRSGETANLRQIEAKALSVSSDPDGGYLVPEQTEAEIGRRLAEISPVRAISGVRQVSASVYKKPFATTNAAVGWVGETDARPQTSTPNLAELQFPTMELYAMPAATGALLDDSVVNIDDWIAEEVQAVFAEQEGKAFVDGDGINKPRGFLDYPRVADGSWTWGNLGYIATGTDGAFDAISPSDVLIDTIYGLRAGYRANGHWVMNRRSQAEIRKIKDADGNYLWHPGNQPGGNATLLNFPIAESEDMPNIASASASIAFGDFRRGYLVVDRLGVRVLRDPYTAKPYVLFYTTKRVGGGVQDFEAIKLIKFGIS
ncbi:MAG: phage major capsid protein [Fimbriimonadaceae bacterium]|nr:phage major capsid protein [Alphaproteobacteria bacterium]